MKNFKEREFENEENSMFTFLGRNDKFCIMFNGECIHSVKTLKVHNNKVLELVNKHDLEEVEND